MRIASDAHKYAKARHTTMREARRHMWPIWRAIASVYLPYTHPWLLDGRTEKKISLSENYITSTGLQSVRVQTAGLMNGITSPTRPWIKYGIGPDDSKLSIATRKWLYQSAAITHMVLARSNYYNTQAMSYFDIGLFGISGKQIFEDYRDVIRVQRYNVGEFYVAFDSSGRLYEYSRECTKTLQELHDDFGEENLPPQLRDEYKNPISRGRLYRTIHFVSRKIEGLPSYVQQREWRELYYLQDGNIADGDVLSAKGYREQPGTFPRWGGELLYGNSPGLDAYADMCELIQLLLDKGVGIEKMVKPPMLYDAQLRNQKKSTAPDGYSYVANLANFTGARPLYQTQIPVQELRADIQEVKSSIQEIFHNPLFNMISQLDTVRSANEIDARREEKLVLLSHFLERFENEALDPDIERVFNICMRAGLFPDPPAEVRNNEIDIQYISILTTAQRALNTVPMERMLQAVGEVINVAPNVLDLINFDEYVYTYGRDIGVQPAIFNDTDQVAALRQARNEREQQAALMEQSGHIIDAARNLSETKVQGGANALERVLG